MAMGILHKAATAVGEALSPTRAGVEKLATRRLAAFQTPDFASSPDATSSLMVTSPSFVEGGMLPKRCALEGGSEAPALRWSDGPSATASWVVLCEDPDAPLPAPFVHWLVYDLPADTRSIDAATAERFKLGKNSLLQRGFTGAAPPPGHGLHHYHFQVIALNVPLALEDAAGRDAVVAAMEGHVLAWGELVGVYERE
jgi:hypothetical protein